MLSTIPYERLTPARLPWLSLALAALWLLVFGASWLWPDAGWQSLPLLPAHPTAASLAGHWLLHESWAHLATSLLLLLAAGAVLEDAWGHLPFAGFWVLMLACGTASCLVAQADAARPLVGPSGALAGLLGACIVRNFRQGIQYTAIGWWREPVHTRLWVPSFALLAPWFVGEVLMQLVDTGVGPTRGLSHAGQASAALLGALVAGAVLQWDLEQRWLGHTPGDDRHPALDAAERALARSGGDAALRVLEPAVQKAPADAELVAALCRAACVAAQPERATQPFLRLIRSSLRAGEGSVAAGLWADWARPLSHPALDARLALLLAEALAARDEGVEAARVLRELLKTPGRVTAGMALRIVELAQPLHAGVAIRAAHLALESGEFPAAKRERLEQTLRALERRRSEQMDPELDEGGPARRADRTIEIEPDEDLYRPPAGGAIAEAAAPAPAAFELNADGSLEGSSRDAELAAAGLDVAAAQPRFADAKCIDVVPVGWEQGRLRLERSSGPTAWLEVDQVQAVAAAAVRGLAARPVVLIDLLLNWSDLGEGPLKVLRLRSDRFAPAVLLPGAGAGLDGFRAVLDALLARSRATPLPDERHGRGRPFAMFDGLEAYERRVLLIER